MHFLHSVAEKFNLTRGKKMKGQDQMEKGIFTLSQNHKSCLSKKSKKSECVSHLKLLLVEENRNRISNSLVKCFEILKHLYQVRLVLPEIVEKSSILKMRHVKRRGCCYKCGLTFKRFFSSVKAAHLSTMSNRKHTAKPKQPDIERLLDISQGSVFSHYVHILRNTNFHFHFKTVIL